MRFGNYYGTSKPIIEDVLNSGVDVFLDIDWQSREPKCLRRSIFILPLSKMNFIADCVVVGKTAMKLLKNACHKVGEIEHFNEYDYLIVNDDFNTALSDLQSIIRTERLKLGRQVQRHDALISKLLAD